MKLKLNDSLSLTDNSKECDPHTLFLATQNSARYSDDARQNGAKTVITPKELPEYLDISGVEVIGITGTNGKTTTAALIYSLLLDLGYKVAMSGTRGYFINEEQIESKSLTTVDVLTNYARIAEAKKSGCRFYITEVSSHAIDQQRLEGIPYALKVLTNITQDHLDYHGNLGNYIATKNAFFSDESVKLINKEEKHAEFNVKNAYTYAIEEQASFNIKAYSLLPKVSGVVQFGSETGVFESNLVGMFNLHNILAAVAAVKIVTDKSIEDICEAVGGFGGVEGRVQVVSEEPLVIVDFAHTHDGMKQIFESFPSQNIVTVFGAGGDRDRTKRPLMGMAAARFAERIFITSDNPRSEAPEAIAEDILRGIPSKEKATVILDRKQAIEEAIGSLRKNEVLLILGKGDEETMEIKGRKIPFKDRDVVEEYLLKQHKQG